MAAAATPLACAARRSTSGWSASRRSPASTWRRGDDRLLAHLGLRLHRLNATAVAPSRERRDRGLWDVEPRVHEDSTHGRHDSRALRGPRAADPAIGADLAARMPRPRAVAAARVERRMQEMLMSDPALRAALFRFVDVRRRAPRPPTSPATCTSCSTTPASPARPPRVDVGRKLATRPVAAIAATGVSGRQRFIVGANARTRCRRSPACEERRRRHRRPARRGHRLRGRGRPLHAALRGRAPGPVRPPRAVPGARREPLRQGLRARPLLRPEAPERGIDGARPRLRRLPESPRRSAPTCTSTWSPSTRVRRSRSSRSTC